MNVFKLKIIINEKEELFMFRKQMKLFITIFVMFFYLLFVGGDVLYAQGPTVKLIVNPNKTDVFVGADPVALTAKATGTGLQFTWELQGPGRTLPFSGS